MKTRQELRLPVRRLSPSATLLFKWRLMSSLWGRGPLGRTFARLIRGHIRRAYGCYIAPTSTIGRAVYLPHPVGVVIGDNSVVGDGVTIYQNVTLGQASSAGKCPSIEEGATVFAGAVLIGEISIGRGSKVGANAVVRTSVPAGAVAVGVPARVLERKP